MVNSKDWLFFGTLGTVHSILFYWLFVPALAVLSCGVYYRLGENMFDYLK